MSDCVCILREQRETELDLQLIAQAKCCLAMNQITQPVIDWAAEQEPIAIPPAYMIKRVQLELQDIRQSLPPEMQSKR